MLESKIKDAVTKHAIKSGVKYIRMHFARGVRTGWPDNWFLIQGGRPLIIEFKATGKRPTKKQQLRITLLISLEYEVFVCDNIKAGKERIDLALNRAFGRTLR